MKLFANLCAINELFQIVRFSQVSEAYFCPRRVLPPDERELKREARTLFRLKKYFRTPPTWVDWFLRLANEDWLEHAKRICFKPMSFIHHNIYLILSIFLNNIWIFVCYLFMVVSCCIAINAKYLKRILSLIYIFIANICIIKKISTHSNF